MRSSVPASPQLMKRHGNESGKRGSYICCRHQWRRSTAGQSNST